MHRPYGTRAICGNYQPHNLGILLKPFFLVLPILLRTSETELPSDQIFFLASFASFEAAQISARLFDLNFVFENANPSRASSVLKSIEFVIIACVARFGNDPNRIAIGPLAHYSRHAAGKCTRWQLFRTLASRGFAIASTRPDRIPSHLSGCIFFALLERLSKTRILALGAFGIADVIFACLVTSLDKIPLKATSFFV